MDRSDVERWVEGYVKAWSSNDPDDIGALFTEDATYYTAPHRESWRGRQAIVEGWLDRKDQPGSWGFEYRVQDVVGDKAYVRGTTTYHDQDESDYSNLWEVTLDREGRCSEFIEWWMVVDTPGAG
ncbi:MAG TPA: nuclear transport factor 2 family protein [Actinomycetota bacterium]|nr:nuclear transport factor 2 family protein [Actinomycetota bacterium]